MSNSLQLFLLGILLFSASLLASACKTSSQPASSTAANSPPPLMPQNFVPGEALVKFKPSVPKERIDEIFKETETELITEIKGIGVLHVRIVGKDSVETLVKKLSAYQEVEFAEPNFRLKVQ